MAPGPLLIPRSSHARLGEAVWDQDGFLGTLGANAGQLPVLRTPCGFKSLALYGRETSPV